MSQFQPGEYADALRWVSEQVRKGAAEAARRDLRTKIWATSGLPVEAKRRRLVECLHRRNGGGSNEADRCLAGELDATLDEWLACQGITPSPP